MTPAAVQITTVLITAVATILASFFARSFVEWRKGKKDEAQKMANDRDKIVAQLEEVKNDRHEVYKRKHEWISAYYALEHIALKYGISQSDLPTKPTRED